MLNNPRPGRGSRRPGGESHRKSIRIRQTARYLIESLERRLLLTAGDLDPTFGSGGKVLLPDHSGSLSYFVNATAVQGDGKILLVGRAFSSNPDDRPQQDDFFLERLNINGTVDTHFGNQGIVTTSFPRLAEASSIILQPDGKILLGGTMSENQYFPYAGQFALARYNPNGSLDPTFGSHGLVLTQIPGQTVAGVTSLALAPKGKILAGGGGGYQVPLPSDPSYGIGTFDVVRYDSNGNLDTSFGGNGYVVCDGATGESFSNGISVAAQKDGKVVLGAALGYAAAFWRYNVDGSLDTTFGLGGHVNGGAAWYGPDDDYSSSSIYYATVLPDGEIVGADFTDFGDGMSDGTGLFTYNPTSGQPAPTASPDFVAFPDSLAPGGMGVDPEGNIVIGGPGVDQSYSYPGTASFFNVSLTSPDGSPTGPFDSLPLKYFDGAGDLNVCYTGATAVATDGKIVVAGNTYDNSYDLFDPNRVGGIAVFRLQGEQPAKPPPPPPHPKRTNPPAGGFDAGGRLWLNDPDPVALPYALTNRINATTVLPNGQILLAGSTGAVADNGEGQFYLQCLNADGTVDTPFGNNGSVTTSIGPNAFATSMLVLPNGDILLGGGTDDSATTPTVSSFALACYKPNGKLDTSFGNGGIVITDFPGIEQIDSLALSPGGQIVAAGSYSLAPNVGFDIARYQPNGSLDTRFDGTGMVSFNLGPTGFNSLPAAVGVQSDSKIVVGSHANDEFAVYGFNSDGTIDSSFGTSGVAVVTGLPDSSPVSTSSGGIAGSITKLVILSDGGIVGAGLTGEIYAMVRFQVDGTLDRRFGTDGVALAQDAYGYYPSAEGIPPIAALTLQSNGEIILAGGQVPADVEYVFAETVVLLRKFFPDGTPDPNFQADGDPGFLPPPPDNGFVATAGAITPSGNIILAGNIWMKDLDGYPFGSVEHATGVVRYPNSVTGYFQVTNLATDGRSGSLPWAIQKADSSTTPVTMIGFSQALVGTIALGSPALVNNSGNTIWIGDANPQLVIDGDFTMGGSEAVQLFGLTLGTSSHSVHIEGSDSLTITNCTIWGTLVNSAQYEGFTIDNCMIWGGISQESGGISISASTFLGTPGAAEGLSIGPGASGGIVNSTFSRYSEAAISTYGPLSVVNCTISANTGTGVVSANDQSLPVVSMGNTIVAANASGPGGDVSGPFTSLGHNLIGDTDGSTGWVSSDLTGSSATPLDPRLLPLGYYGGSTPTMPPRPGGPAVGAGDPEVAYENIPPTYRTWLEQDQRGFSRFTNVGFFPPAYQVLVDIGSVQTSYITFNFPAGYDAATFEGEPGGDVYWTIDRQYAGDVFAADPLASLTINSNGDKDVISLDYSSGNPIFRNLHLNGTFTINGMQGSNPLAGVNLDMNRSTVYISYADAASDPIAKIRSYLRNGFNNGAWNGTATPSTGAITSMPAAQNARQTTAIGYADSASGLVPGQPANTIELKYTLYGDTLLSGTVGASDFSVLTQHYKQTTGGTWDTGDFNYDGSVNFNDFTLLTRAYNTSLGNPAVPSATGAQSR